MKRSKPARRLPRDGGPRRVVGIGASAGGLEALTSLVAAIEPSTGLAFIVLQHLAESQAGKLAAALERRTQLPVVDAANGQGIEANTIYVVPPYTRAAVVKGALVLQRPSRGRRPHLPIDELFVSLAKALGERAVGVVLSGTGSDGTEGLRAIHDAHGIVIVQDPSTAQFDEMPRSAIAAGLTAHLAAPEQIALDVALLDAPQPAPVADGAFARILAQLHDLTAIDFSLYKRSTIERRLARQVGRHNFDSLEEYADYLAAHPEEATVVYEDLLVHVTELFRDGTALEDAIAALLPELLEAKPAGEPIRVWVPGCSTGDEVYSLAIALLEALRARDEHRTVQLFGTDLSERAIERARAGCYAAAAVAKLDKARVARFFTPDGDGYRIANEVRERCVFVRHDLVSDPPFSRLDLVSCRNVLIYLGAPLQKRVFPIFHYALNQPGYLLLGRTESIAGFDTLFERAVPGDPLYKRKPTAATPALAWGLAGQLGRSARRAPDVSKPAFDVLREVDQVLLARYGPACVLVDGNHDILQFRGRTGPYLEPTPGHPQLNVVKMAREGLGPLLQRALQRAARDNTSIHLADVAIEDGAQHRTIHVDIIPIQSSVSRQRHFLVVFDADGSSTQRPKKRKAKPRRDRVEDELVATKEYLSSMISQHLATTEELGIVNEELQSTNEELSSSNEELQSAKEELQSTNEELETVNEQLEVGNRELRDLNDDLVNVLASVDIPIIIVDAEHRIRRFTPRARVVFQLLASDLGRPIADLQPQFDLGDLPTDLTTVIQSLSVIERVVRGEDDSYHRMHIRPYRTVDDRISGAVITFVDITRLCESLELADSARDYANAIVDTVPSPLAVLDRELRIVTANRAWRTRFGAPATRPSLFAPECGRWHDEERLRAAIAEMLDSAEPDSIEMMHVQKSGDCRDYVVTARALPLEPAVSGVLVALLDITDRMAAEQAREALVETERAARAASDRDKQAFLRAVSHELRTPLSAILLWTRVLYEEVDGNPELRRGLDTIQRSAEAEARLVDDLIDLAAARTDGAGLVIELQPTDPALAIHAAVEAVRAEAEQKRVELEVDLATGLRVSADPNRLQQIAWNLARNAIAFTPPDGRVSLSLCRSGSQIELQVRDTGKGIDSGFLADVFEPFTREDGSLSQAHSGLGIGLALVRHLIERHGGTIEVASGGENRGSTFRVRLPALA